MKTPDIFDLYTDYLITSFSHTTATGLSGLVDNAISHDLLFAVQLHIYSIDRILLLPTLLICAFPLTLVPDSNGYENT
jgi:hypothetical protein